MVLRLLDPFVIDTRSWKVVDIKTWEVNFSIFLQQMIGAKKFVGIVTQVLWFEELLQCDELQPYTSVEVEVFEDAISVERRS